ncbi:unnamed protein product [Phaeothamnion confervicola]
MPPKRTSRSAGFSVLLFFGAILRGVTVRITSREHTGESAGVLNIEKIADAPGMTSGANPSFVILGVGKGGTTDLHETIMQSFGDLFNTPIRKEVSDLLAGANIYRHGKTSFNESYYMELLGKSDGLKPFTIDATPQYIHYPELVTSHLRSVTNDSIGLLLLRHPVTRCRSLYSYSQYHIPRPGLHALTPRFSLLNGSIWTFAKAAAWELDLYQRHGRAELAVLNGAGASWRERVDAFNSLSDLYYDTISDIPLVTQPGKQLLLNGIYPQNVKAFVALKGFGRQRLLILQSELYWANVEPYLREIIGPFMFGRGRPDMQRREWSPYRSNQTVYIEESTMLPELACRLQKFYNPSMRRLMEVLAAPEVASVAYVWPPTDARSAAWWQRAEDSFCAKEPSVRW